MQMYVHIRQPTYIHTTYIEKSVYTSLYSIIHTMKQYGTIFLLQYTIHYSGVVTYGIRGDQINSGKIMSHITNAPLLFDVTLFTVALFSLEHATTVQYLTEKQYNYSR